MISVSSKSIIVSIIFLGAPRAIELTVIDDELCPPLQPYFSLVYTRFSVDATCHDGDAWCGLGTNFKSTSVNLQFT